MKKIIALLLVLVMTVCLFSACQNPENPEKDPEEQPVVKEYGKIFYVAVDGSDENEGTKESPLATLGGAVAKVREYKAANGLPEGGIKVEFGAGIYKVTTQTDFTAEDGGEEGKEIVYAAADGAEVIFDGGTTLSAADFKPANDEFKAKLVSDEAKANVLEIDLAAAGIWDADDTREYYIGWTAYYYRQTLYVNNELQTVARWPNEGYYKPGKVTKDAFVGEDGVSYGLIPVSQEKADLWKNNGHIRFYGYPTKDWSTTFVWDIKVDPDNSVLYYPMNHDYGLESTCYFMLFNIPEELDMPGEYYWDVAANKLYYWPKDGFENAKISFSQFVGSAITLTETDHVTFDGFTFENLRYNAVSSEKSQSDFLTISNCVFRCIASFPINLSGSDILISDNEFYNLGGGAVSLKGGNIAKQTLSKNIITNNLIHDWSQVYTVYNAGISTDGMGYVISHNKLYNSPHEAITYGSGNTVVEYNDIYNVCTETMDAGAVYTGRRWDWGNSVVRYNYIHDMPTSANGIYFDDTLAKQSCYGNVLVNIGGNALMIGGGRLISAYNNVMVNTGSVWFDGRGYGWYPTWNSYPDEYMWKSNVKANYLTDIWKYMQPEYLSMLEMRTTEVDRARGIVSDMLDSPGPSSYSKVYNNVVYNFNFSNPSEKSVNSIDSVVSNFGYVDKNTEYTERPEDVFADPANGNFFLKEDSRVYRDIIGFEKWDYSLIGIQK